MPSAADVAALQMQGQDIPWLLQHWASVKPEHPFLVWEPRDGEGRTWTYAQFLSDVRRLAAGLAGRGVSKGDKVLIHADNCPEAVLAWYACAWLGAVGVTTNTAVGRGGGRVLRREGPVRRGASCSRRTAPWCRRPPRGLRFLVTTDRPLECAVRRRGGCPAREPEPLLPAGILFTSGTTSKPKAVVHTHANAIWAGRIGPRNIDLNGDDRYLVYLPFFHVNAQSWSIWAVLGVGATVVLHAEVVDVGVLGGRAEARHHPHLADAVRVRGLPLPEAPRSTRSAAGSSG